MRVVPVNGSISVSPFRYVRAQTRRIKERLRILRSAVPRPVEPSRLLGRVVVRPTIDGVAVASRGRVVEHDEFTGFRVLYNDGGCEDVTLRELQAVCTQACHLCRTMLARDFVLAHLQR